MDPRWKPIRRIQQVTAPGAGNGFTITAERSEHWLIRSLTFTFVTDANAAIRVVGINVDQSGVIYQRYGAADTILASSTRTFGSFPGASRGSAAGANIAIDCPTDGYWLPHGSDLNLTVDSIQAGDAITSIAFEAWAFPIGPNFSMYPFVPVFTEESE